MCGSYSYRGGSLSGAVYGLQWSASSLKIHEGTLYSFGIDSSIVPCIAVAMDYMAYSASSYFGAACPVQNAIMHVSYEENHASYGMAGDVAVRSKLEIVRGNGDTIVRDSHGIYKLDATGKLTMMFGEQQGRPAVVLTGWWDSSGVYVDGYNPPGPCTWDGSSMISSMDQLSQHLVANIPLP